MSYYIAYGSNLSVEQMQWRCPDAYIVGYADLEGWRLSFGRHATIEPCEGASTPVLIWSVSKSDEKALDRYEGYPKYYHKAYLNVDIQEIGGTDSFGAVAMVYIMADIQKSGRPMKSYVDTIREGYRRFGFDEKILDDALEEVGCGDMIRLTRWNGERWILPQGRTSDGRSYWRLIAERLAAYEDTGLTPEEIENLKGVL